MAGIRFFMNFWAPCFFDGLQQTGTKHSTVPIDDIPGDDWTGIDTA
jgi:hypothetical protein